MKAWIDWDELGTLHRPVFGQATLWILLLCAQPLAWYFQSNWHTYTLGDVAGQTHFLDSRTGPASILSILPDWFLLNPIPMQLAGVLFTLGSILWAGGWLVPYSGWLTSLAFTIQVALYMENSTQATHVAHLTNMMLLLYAAWYQCLGQEIRAALRAGQFWTTPLYPQWVHTLAVFYIGLFYGMSGLMKLWTSGPGWANGLSLQLWVKLWGNPNSLATQLILDHRWMARLLQITTLVGETGGLLAIVSRPARIVVGLLLISFHVGAIAVFGWGFHANLILLALFFFPCDRWLTALTQNRAVVTN